MKATSGIYVIVNSRNKKFYIGSARYFKTRRTDHFRELRGNYHHCKHLQRAYNTEENKSVFVFMPIFYCSSDDATLVKTEQWFLDINWQNKERGLLYNSSMIAGRPEMTAEVRKKIGDANKGKPAWNKGILHKPETCAKISAATKGRPSPNKGKKFSEEHCVNLSIAHKGKPALKTQGRLHWNAKLTETDVQYIRASNDRSIDLARKFGIRAEHINDIRARRCWKHIF